MGSYIEMVIKDVSMAAQGITKDAIHRIKSHLPHIFPSLNYKLVDDRGKGSRGKESEDEVEQQSKVIDASPTSSFFTSIVSPPPLSKL